MLASCRPMLGFGFVGCGAVLVVSAASAGVRAAREAGTHGANTERRLARLARPTPDEQGVVAGYVENHKAAERFPEADPVIRGIVARGLLQRPAQFMEFNMRASGMPMVLTYVLPDWIRDVVEVHPELIQRAARVRREADSLSRH